MTAEEWNRMYPSGTLVRYFPIKGMLDEYEDCDTDGSAFEDTNNEPVIRLRHKVGYFSLEHITPLEEPVVEKR